MKKAIAFGLAFLPSVAFAAITDVSSIFDFAMKILNSITVLLMAAAVVYFLYGVFQFIKAAGDEEARAEGRNKIIYGIIGLFVMGSVYGLVNILTSTFGLSSTSSIKAPELPTLPTN